MVYISKLFTAVLFLSLVTISTSSCSNQESEAQNGNKTQQAFAEAQPADTESNAAEPEVHQVLSVAPSSQPGKIRDFMWMENGEKKLFSEYVKDKVVFLNFWATWCGPCRHEIPAIIEINKEMNPDDFVVVGIFLERDRYNSPENSMKRVKNFAKSKGINYINFNPTQELEKAYGRISGIPTTFIIDKDGNIKEKIVGARRKADFIKSIKKVMDSSKN